MIQQFVQQVNDTVRGIVEGIHTAMPGKIVSFDPASCRAAVQPEALYRKPDGSTLPYPVISGVPVVIPQSCGQSVTIAYPVKEGDGCLIIVAEQSLDYWMYEQQTGTNLRFDLTDSICIPGLFHTPNAALTKACQTGSVVIVSPSVQIEGDVSICGDLTVQGDIAKLD